MQIHTTDLQQQPEPERSYRNGFRRKTAEIKSEAELIKSELAEAAAKERINATPTPPTAKTISGDACTDLAALATSACLHKCPSCPFLSLCQLKAQTHIASCFGVDAQQHLQCPGECKSLVIQSGMAYSIFPFISLGCANVFYNIDVLNLHLSADHQLEPQEISTLTLNGSGKPNETGAKKAQQAQAQSLQEPKSRIFIKNVDCLREPLRLQEENQLSDFLPLLSSPPGVSSGNILDLLNVVEVVEQPEPVAVNQKPAGQKISIKSVDVLREPALLPYDFQQQLPSLPALMMSSSSNNNNMLDAPVVDPEKPRQPKIYIRNVDILKEPMLLPGFTASTVNRPTDVFPAETLLTPTGPVGSLPGFEPALAPLANMCSEAFNFEASNNFSALDLDFGVDFEPQVPLVTEATPPPPAPPPAEATQISLANGEQLVELAVAPQSVELNTQLASYLPVVAPPPAAAATKQKIFIKNVDILKAPQRGTLHLRTVDELNLMNRNEVEHLIVPNREPLPMELPLHAAAAGAALEPSLVDFHQHAQQAAAPAALSYDDSYDLAEDLECWPWMEEGVPAAIATVDTEQEAAPLELPHNAEDMLIKDYQQLYATPDVCTAVPPLVPVTVSPVAPAALTPVDNLSCLPVPPLVPLVADTATPATALPTAVTSPEKPARIYVANNLLPAAVEPTLAGGTSVRGRPYGAKQTGQNRRRPVQGVPQSVEGGKCTVDGCMFRFKSPATLDYHGRCHNGALGSAQPMICPECRSTQFSNWNCLHTHLWRTHEIDMELYCCQLCSFKTPIYSRLVNTHAKIHSEERNYKCTQCGKGFKNTKQLKNHRRLHRTQGLGMAKPSSSADELLLPEAATVHRCEDCSAVFKHRKTLREHLCKQRNEQPQCSVCQVSLQRDLCQTRARN